VNLILRNARVVDPANGIDCIGDIAIAGDRIVEPASLSQSESTRMLDVSGKVVVPGLIDMHVHLREPGQEYKEDIASGTRAAAAGGFTTILGMPNTKPAIDRAEVLADLQQRVDRRAVVRVYTVACLTKDRAGSEIADLRSYADHKIVLGLSDDGECVQDFALMEEIARIAADMGLPIIDHCEDRSIMDGGVMRRGVVSEALGVPGMPGATESNMVARNIELARRTGAHFHMQHISYVESVRLVREARGEGLPVTAEAMPHHLLLTHESVRLHTTHAKMNPPLGTEEDRQALLAAVVDGAVSVIATDHAPHSPAEKARGLVEAPFGIIGLQEAVPLLLTELVCKGYMDLSTLIARFTVGPAQVLNLPSPSLKPGQLADITILDLNTESTIDLVAGHSKSCNSPFHGRRVRGAVVGTMVGGRWVHGQLGA